MVGLRTRAARCLKAGRPTHRLPGVEELTCSFFFPQPLVALGAPASIPTRPDQPMVRRCGRCQSVESRIDLSDGTPERHSGGGETRDWSHRSPDQMIIRIADSASVAGPGISPTRLENLPAIYTRTVKRPGRRRADFITTFSSRMPQTPIIAMPPDSFR